MSESLYWAVITVLVLLAVLAAGTPRDAEVGPLQTEPPEQIEDAEAAPVIAWPRFPVPLDDDLQRYIIMRCRMQEVDPSIVFAVIGEESGYDAEAVGDGGNSLGLMQIYASVHEERMYKLGVTDLLDPYQNVTVGIDILAELLSWGRGMDYALSFYSGNGGEPCEYALTVQRNAECLMEGVMVVTG